MYDPDKEVLSPLQCAAKYADFMVFEKFLKGIEQNIDKDIGLIKDYKYVSVCFSHSTRSSERYYRLYYCNLE